MRLAERMLRDLRSTFDGQAWHGTPVRKMVDGITFADQIAWLERAHASLLETVAKMDDDEFDRKVPDGRYTKDFMLRGLINHTAYHSAQIAMLKKFG